MDRSKNIYLDCRWWFRAHKASIVHNDDNFLIIDWRKANGSNDYYVNYVVDKRRGMFAVSGDLGNSIAVWGNEIKPEKLKEWIYNDPGYYASKIKCSSNLYYYDEQEIIDELKAEGMGSWADEDTYLFWERVKEEVQNSIHKDELIPTKELIQMIEERCERDSIWLGSLKKLSKNIYLWAVGFKMACDQLGI